MRRRCVFFGIGLTLFLVALHGFVPAYAQETISFSGWVKTAPNWPSTDGMAPVVGATVSALDGNGGPIGEAVTADLGAFSITGIPSLSPFRLVVPPSDGFVAILSKIFNWQENIQALLPFSRFTDAQYAAFSNTQGTGMILGRVTRQDNPTAFLAGATVMASEYTFGGPPMMGTVYPTTYSGGDTATGADGVYMVKNVPDGKRVQLTVMLPDHAFAFNGAIVPVAAGVVSEESFFATPAGPVLSSHVGTWGAHQLIHFDDGYNLVGDVQVPWYAEISRTTLNEDGTGTMVMTKNDLNGQLITTGPLEFDYTVEPNADGSLNITIPVAEGQVGEPLAMRMVISDDGQMGIVDGTAKEHQQKLMVFYRIDTTKTYANADVSGDYYSIGFERNATDVTDPPNGNGTFMAISSIHAFNGSGSYGYSGKANSVTLVGANLIWDDPGQTDQAYSVSPDGTFSAGGGAFRGWFTGSALAGGGGGFFLNGANNQVSCFFLKKGDRVYTTADLAGKWAVVSLGQDSKTTEPTIEGFVAAIGTMVCDPTGNCSIKARERSSDNSTAIVTDMVTVSVLADGSFGASLGGQSPAYAGMIGNNGNTILINSGFMYESNEDPNHREIVIGIRASHIGDLTSGLSMRDGDVNADGSVDLADVVLALQVMAGMTPNGIRQGYAASGADVNGDGNVGLAEAVNGLQKTAGLRP